MGGDQGVPVYDMVSGNGQGNIRTFVGMCWGTYKHTGGQTGEDGGKLIKFWSYNISNGRNRVLEYTLQGMG